MKKKIIPTAMEYEIPIKSKIDRQIDRQMDYSRIKNVNDNFHESHFT